MSFSKIVHLERVAHRSWSKRSFVVSVSINAGVKDESIIALHVFRRGVGPDGGSC